MEALDISINFVEEGDGGWFNWYDEVEIEDPIGWHPVAEEKKDAEAVVKKPAEVVVKKAAKHLVSWSSQQGKRKEGKRSEKIRFFSGQSPKKLSFSLRLLCLN